MKQAANIVILGGGESGVGAALLAKAQGAKVFVSDYGQISKRYQEELREANIDFEEGQHTEERILTANEVIKSPGIPEKVAIVQKIKAAGIPVIGEIEYAGRYTNANLLGVTGSNGKTTTVYLVHHLLKAAGVHAELVGNVGYSFARALAQKAPAEVYVIELSSFQLDSIESFRLQLAAVLNITPDHLDRYNYQMSEYIASKLRITMNQQAEDHFWYLQQDENVADGLAQISTPVQLHALSKSVIDDHQLPVGDITIDLHKTALRGRHNALNALFAANMVLKLGVSAEQVASGLASFQPVPHRLEPVGHINGVDYINDSKATNVDAVSYALEAMNQPIVWIAGGTDKGNDYAPITALVRDKVKALVCLGLDNTKLKAAFGDDFNDITETQSAADAVQLARQLAAPGDVVLLSPACASFDLFDNYIDRGDQFRLAVQEMINET